MKTRVISAIVMLVIVISCFAVSPLTRALLLLAITVMAVWEMCRAIGETGAKCANAVLYIFVVAESAAIYFGAEAEITEALFFLAVFACLAAGVLSKNVRGKGALDTVAVLVYPVVPMLIILKLAISSNWIPVFALGCVSAWFCDAFALFGGKWFGKNKLAPEVSPNKTVEGTLTGAAFSVIAGIILYFLLKNNYGLSLFCCAFTALVCSSFGQIGDLVASLIKRMADLKDYSNLIPGHGGVMDRIDSLLFSIPTAYFCILLMTM